jgi:prepilin-type N-terminal cleavage/methylation domain-containing protein
MNIISIFLFHLLFLMIKSIPDMKCDATCGSIRVFPGIANAAVGRRRSSRRFHAFTLVELLVVIGIIALLISVLLPALNKARQQANYIECQSGLRQIGQALNIYVTENNGLLPWCDVRNDKAGGTTSWESGNLPNSTDEEFSWYWEFALSQEIQTNLISRADGLVHNLSPIFRDTDTIQAADYRYVNNYTCNPQIFQDNWESAYLQDGTPIAPQSKVQRRLSQIKPNNVFLIWCAPQCADWNNNAYEQATEVDGNELTFGTYLFTNTPNSALNYNRPVSPGLAGQSQSAASCALLQRKWNVDLGPGQGYFLSHLRFRHLNNTAMAALCVDGHVETRNVGTFMVLDVCVQPLQQ